MKPAPHAEPAQQRVRSQPRALARGSSPPHEPRLIRTRAAVVVKTARAGVEPAVADKPTREVRHAANLFAMLDPDPEPTDDLDVRQTRRMPDRVELAGLFEAPADGKTGRLPLCDWTPPRTPSIDVVPGEPDPRRAYRRGVVTGIAIALVAAASLATVFAWLA